MKTNGSKTALKIQRLQDTQLYSRALGLKETFNPLQNSICIEWMGWDLMHSFAITLG